MGQDLKYWHEACTCGDMADASAVALILEHSDTLRRAGRRFSQVASRVEREERGILGDPICQLVSKGVPNLASLISLFQTRLFDSRHNQDGL